MQPPKLKAYRPGSPMGENVFFIQSKGLNSGQPLKAPIPNCFIASCNSAEELAFWTAICTALWLGKRFEYLLIGSVIPFIRISETNELLRSMRNLDTDQVRKTAVQLNMLSDLHRQTLDQAQLIKAVLAAQSRALTSLL